MNVHFYIRGAHFLCKKTLNQYLYNSNLEKEKKIKMILKRRMNSMKRYDITTIEKAFTHGGVFHADDVFSTALIKMLNPNVEVERGFQVPEDFVGVVYDIGGGEFDHHQTDKALRANGKPYAAFGLLWRSYGHELLEDKYVEDFDRLFVEQLDYSDNTGEFNLLANVISKMNPNWNENISADAAFDKAVAFAMEILEHYMANYRAKENAYKEVEKYIINSEILVLPKFVPWKEAVCHRDIYYVIFPSNRGGYNIQAVPMSPHDITLKKGFPEAWRGCQVDRLRELTGVETVTFCHSAGFMSATETLEDAIKLAKISMRQ